LGSSRVPTTASSTALSRLRLGPCERRRILQQLRRAGCCCCAGTGCRMGSTQGVTDHCREMTPCGVWVRGSWASLSL
jgi:hypothetical protein